MPARPYNDNFNALDEREALSVVLVPHITIDIDSATNCRGKKVIRSESLDPH